MPARDTSAVRNELDRILVSPVFARSPRMSRFLRFVVEEALAGNGDRIKEYVIALEVFEKRDDYDPQADSTVRTEASKLRARLNRYYETEGREDPVVITIPKGTYVPMFGGPQEEAPRPEPLLPEGSKLQLQMVGTGRTKHHLSVRSLAVVGLLAIAVAVPFIAVGIAPMMRSISFRRAPLLANIPTPLTALPGYKSAPSLSPDGNSIVFGWTGPSEQSRLNLYVKAVGSETMRRLTNHAGWDESPVWSPDGQEIAFVRAGQGVFVMSQVGGHERRIATSGTHVGWTPDGNNLLVRDREGDSPYAIFQVSMDTGERHQLTRPRHGMGDWRFAPSPDGKTLAFIRYGQPGYGDVYVAALQGGEPRRLTNWAAALDGLAWMPDGQEIVYDVEESSSAQLWRIASYVTSPGKGTRLIEAVNARSPTISNFSVRRPTRLAYQERRIGLGMHLTPMTPGGPLQMLSASQSLNTSTRDNLSASFSADGRRLAFASDRTGRLEIWVSGRDGSELYRLTYLNGIGTAYPAWAPDGKTIAFQSSANGSPDIYVVSVEGGTPRRLTQTDAIDAFPHWSRDGQWIYFTSNRSGAFQIWKMSSSGEHAAQVTRNGGFEGQESPDGKSIYYAERPPPSATGVAASAKLMRIPVEGGEPLLVIPHVWPFHWTATQQGIYYLRLGEPDVLFLYGHIDNRTIRLGTLPRPVSRGDGNMTVSADGRWLLTCHVERADTDFMLIDNFR